MEALLLMISLESAHTNLAPMGKVGYQIKSIYIFRGEYDTYFISGDKLSPQLTKHKQASLKAEWRFVGTAERRFRVLDCLVIIL